MDNYPRLLMIILLAWMIFVIIRLMNIYWCKEVFLLSSVVWISGRSAQNIETKNLRFYDFKILGCILGWLFYDDYFMMIILWWLLLWWLLWWWLLLWLLLFYDDYFIMILMMMIILRWFYDDHYDDDYFMMILWWLL